MSFNYELGEEITITASGETGDICGRAEYSAQENQYYIHYKAADGRAVEAWWGESALSISL